MLSLAPTKKGPPPKGRAIGEGAGGVPDVVGGEAVLRHCKSIGADR